MKRYNIRSIYQLIWICENILGDILILPSKKCKTNFRESSNTGAINIGICGFLCPFDCIVYLTVTANGMGAWPHLGIYMAEYPHLRNWVYYFINSSYPFRLICSWPLYLTAIDDTLSADDNKINSSGVLDCLMIIQVEIVRAEDNENVAFRTSGRFLFVKTSYAVKEKIMLMDL